VRAGVRVWGGGIGIVGKKRSICDELVEAMRGGVD
jgi:hypothetical protein